MPVLSTFEPNARPGDLAATGAQVDSTMRSWMDRSREEDRAQAAETRASTIFDQQQQALSVARPILEARQQADMLEAQAKIESARQLESDRKVAYALLPEARKDFGYLMAQTDADSRERLAKDWIDGYSQLEGVSDLEPEMKAKKDIIGKILTESAAMRKLDEQSQLAVHKAELAADSAREVATIHTDAQAEIQKAKDEAAKAMEDLKATHAKEIETIRGTNAVTTKATVPGKASGGFTDQELAALGAAPRGAAAPAAAVSPAVETLGKRLSPEEAAALPPGTRFIGLDGIPRITKAAAPKQ